MLCLSAVLKQRTKSVLSVDTRHLPLISEQISQGLFRSVGFNMVYNIEISPTRAVKEIRLIWFIFLKSFGFSTEAFFIG